MKKIFIALLITVIIFVFGLFFVKIFFGSSTKEALKDDLDSLNIEASFQNDADLLRLEHLEFWTKLVEDYYNKTGYYPFQQRIEVNDKIGLVRIATKNQQLYFDKDSELYISALDNNSDNFFQEFTVKDFVSEIESKLGLDIDERYDIQKVPTDSVIWYNYFVTAKGYLVWVPCISCGVTQISTLTMDGKTPTVNIVSKEMLNDVPKSLTREEMLNNPIYKKWKANILSKEEYLRGLEKENFNDSK